MRPAFASHARYLKLRERTSFAFAVVSAAAALEVEGGTIRNARLALGGVAAKPWRARAAEEVLEGATADEAAFRRAAEAALADARPSGDNAFKIDLAKRIVLRALTLAAAGTPERLPALPASPSLRLPERITMPEINPTQASPHLRYGSNVGQPLTRRDGILKVTGHATYAADNHPEGMLYAVHAVSTIARGRVTHLDVEAAKAHPGVVEVITPANRPPLMGDPEAKGQSSRSAWRCCRTTASATPTSRSLWWSRRRSRRRPKAPRCSQPRYEVEPARIGLDVRTLRAGGGGDRRAGEHRARRRRGRIGRRRRGASTRLTRRRRNITTPWSRMPLSRPGTATG